MDRNTLEIAVLGGILLGSIVLNMGLWLLVLLDLAE